MKKVLYPFQESNGEFSWRKAMTALITLCFVFACVGYSITHNFNELPESYLYIIGAVFGFYFTKNIFSGISIQKKDESIQKKSDNN